MRYKKYKLEMHPCDLKNKIIVFYPEKMKLGSLPLCQEEMLKWFKNTVKPKKKSKSN